MKWLACSTVVAAFCLGGCFNLKVDAPEPPDTDAYGPPPRRAQRTPRHRRPAGGRGARGGLELGGYDSLARPREPVELAAWLYATTDEQPVRGAEIGFYGKKKLVTSAITDARGIARAPWRPRKPGKFIFTARVIRLRGNPADRSADMPSVRIVVSAVGPRNPVVLVDLDRCVFAGGAQRHWLGSTDFMPGAAAALNRLNRRFAVIYATRRARELSPRTRRLLQERGFPACPVLLSASPPDFGDGRVFKSAALPDLLKTFPDTAAAVCGDEGPAEAYAARGISAFLLDDFGDSDDPEDLFEEARELSRFDRRLNVVTRWSAVEDGIVSGRRYPPGTLATELRRRAARLQRRDWDD